MYKRQSIVSSICFATLLFTANLHADSFGVSVNGTCDAGSCPAVALAPNSSSSLLVDFSITLADGDEYTINGLFGGSNDSNGGGFSTSHDFRVTYEGNPNGGLSAADTLSIEALYAFQTTLASVSEGRGVIGAFGPTIAASSSASSCLAGGIACLGPFSPPAPFEQFSGAFNLDSTAGAFLWDPIYTNNFGAGSAVGSYIVWGQNPPPPPPTAPEPASWLLLGLGLAAIFLRKGLLHLRCKRFFCRSLSTR